MFETTDYVIKGDPLTAETPPSPSGSGGGIAYGTCTTAGNVAVKAVTLSDATGWELKQGASVAVKFSNTNTFSATAQDPVTLNVNNTGAKNIYYGGSANPTGTNTTAFGRANYINTYVYDGTYWVWAGSSQDNNTTYDLSNRSMDVYCETAAATATKVGTAYYFSLKNNSKFHIRFRYANSAQSKLTLNVDDKGAKDLWINGVISSSTNYTLPAGEYECVYYNNAYYLRTDSPYAFIPSHIGQIVESTILASEDDCKKLYGFDTSWIQHEGYVLRGATSNVTDNDNSNSGIGFGGSDTVTLTGAQSGLKGHGHGFTQPTVNGGAAITGEMSGNNPHSHTARIRLLNGGGNGTYGEAWASGGGTQYNVGGNITNLGGNDPFSVINTNIAHTHSQVAHTHSVSGGKVIDAAASDATSSHSVVQRYKNVYIWERTA